MTGHWAVWDIVDTQRRNQVTTVAVSLTCALANAHFPCEFVREKLASVVLTGRHGVESVDSVGPLAISATCDFALVELSEPMSHF